MGELNEHRVTMVYLSHHLDEVFQVCDRAVVLRDGQNAGAYDVAHVDEPTLIHAMIGKDVHYDEIHGAGSENTIPAAQALGFQAEAMPQPISFQLRAGEFLGITGIIGAGKSELGRGLFGASRQQRRHAAYPRRNHPQIHSPRDAQRHDMAFIPEDRKSKHWSGPTPS